MHELDIVFDGASSATVHPEDNDNQDNNNDSMDAQHEIFTTLKLLWLKCQRYGVLLTVVSRNEAARCRQQIKINLKRFPDQFLVRSRLLNDDKRRFRFLSSFWFCTQNRKWTKLDSRTNADRFMNEILLGRTWLMELTKQHFFYATKASHVLQLGSIKSCFHVH